MNLRAMIGFPKTLADFSKYKPSFSPKKEWQGYFADQTDLYLKNQHFFSKKTESWRYFPFQKVMGQNFNFSPPASSLSKQNVSPYFSPSFLISVQNGTALPAFASAENIFFCSWRDFVTGQAKLDSTIQEKALSALKRTRNPFCALNSALYENGFILVIKNNLSRPLEIHYAPGAGNDLSGLNLRNFIFLEHGASAQIAEIFYGGGDRQTLFLNIQTDCFLENSAYLEHIRMDQMGHQDIFINHIFAQLAKEAQAHFFSLSLNAGIARWHTELEQAEKSASDITGLSLLDGKKHADHKAAVRHTEMEGVSRQLYKSFLFDSAKQIFQGLISIDKPAQKSNARQLSKNFLFGKGAFAGAFPELDISADDVQANHGAVVSPFAENRDLIFYLQSRGIDRIQAFNLVVSGLIEEALSRLQPNAQSALKPLLKQKFKSIERSMRGIF